jgi:RNA polymerase sigma-70 factor (ECF subfamily)
MEEAQARAAIQDRDPEGLRALVAAHGDRLLRSACLLCGDATEAQDLVQETFLQALRSGDRFGGRSSVYTWLHGILLNLTRHYHRRRHRIIYDDELARQEEQVPEAPPSSLDLAVSSQALQTALRQLSEPHREVLVLRYFENMKIHELAAHLDLSPGTVKSRLHYALAEMQKILPAEMNLFGVAGTEKPEPV